MNKYIFQLCYLVIFIFSITACIETEQNISPNKISFIKEMRQLAIDISLFIKNEQKTAQIIALNGYELAREKTNGPSQDVYLNLINGIIVENLYYGETALGQKNEISVVNNKKTLLKNLSLPIWNIEYLTEETSIQNVQQENKNITYFTKIEKPDFYNKINDAENANTKSIAIFDSVKNLKILRNITDQSKFEIMEALKKTSWDLIILNPSVANENWTASEISQLKTKKNGAKRLIFCYLPLASYNSKQDFWLKTMPVLNNDLRFGPISNSLINPSVNYWKVSWRNMLFGDKNSYAKYLIDQKFDGYLLGDLQSFELHQ